MVDTQLKMREIHTKRHFEGIQIGGKAIDGRFVIPAGIRCTHASVLEKYFGVDSVGIVTTKSVSAAPRAGHKEPLYMKYGERSYLNAVGLSNPGARAFKEELSRITVPENKFLLVSIFGKDEDEFYEAAEILREYADGFELNMSCPNARGFGLQIGNDHELAGRITERIAGSFDVPVFVKVSATMPNVTKLAKTVIERGASGITAVNTIGPSIEYVGGRTVLSNREGGMSGEAIRPMGLKAVRDIRNEIGDGPVIIGMGGIFGKKDVDSYAVAGADFYGIGSALTNLDWEASVEYLNALKEDLILDRTDDAFRLKPVANMDYNRCVVEEKTRLNDSLFKLKLSRWRDYDQCENTAGKFYFLMLSETGEKPFALFSYADREFVIKRVGAFTSQITDLNPGDTVYLRGPYGKDIVDYRNRTVNLVGGGVGISPLYEIGKRYRSGGNTVRFFLGGREKTDIFDLERFEEIGEVHVATEDGSLGCRGNVAELLSRSAFPADSVFVNVGPKAMIESVFQVEKGVAGLDDIWVSIEYQTSCGVGICGKCATEKGVLSCVDGPFLRVEDAMKLDECRCG